MVFSGVHSKWETRGGTIATFTLLINFGDSVQKPMMMMMMRRMIFPLEPVFFVCVSACGIKVCSRLADHLYLTTAQLGGIGLQESARICLYNVIKAFLGPTASA